MHRSPAPGQPGTTADPTRRPGLRLVSATRDAAMATAIPAERITHTWVLAGVAESTRRDERKALSRLLSRLPPTMTLEVSHLAEPARAGRPRYDCVVRLLQRGAVDANAGSNLHHALASAAPGLWLEPAVADAALLGPARAGYTLRPAGARLWQEHGRASPAHDNGPVHVPHPAPWVQPGVDLGALLRHPNCPPFELKARCGSTKLDDDQLAEWHRRLRSLQAGAWRCYAPGARLSRYGGDDALRKDTIELLQQWLARQSGWWVAYRLQVHEPASTAWLDLVGEAVFGAVPFDVIADEDQPAATQADSVNRVGTALGAGSNVVADTAASNSPLPVLAQQGAPALFPMTDAYAELGLRRYFPSAALPLPEHGVWVGRTAAGPARAPVRLPGDTLLRHVLTTGNSGAGKTTTLLRIGQELMTDPAVRRSVVFMTPHAPDFKRFIRLVPRSRLGDLVVIDVSDERYTASLNPLYGMRDSSLSAHHLASRLCALMDARFETRDSRGPAKQAHLRHTALLAGSHPARHGTILDMVRILEDTEFRDRLIQHCPDASVRNYWKRFIATSGDHGYTNWVPYLQAPLVPLTSHPVLKRLLGRPGRTIDLRQRIDGGGILAVNLSRGTLQEGECSALGAMLLTMLMDAAMSRKETDGSGPTPCHVICDEFQSFAGDGMARLFAESRKFGLGWCVGMQQTSQLANRWGRDALMDAVLTNTATKILFRQGAGDLATLAPLVADGLSPALLGRLPDHHAVVLTPLPGLPVTPFVMEALAPDPLDQPPSDDDLAERLRHGHDTVTDANEELKRCFNLGDANLA